MRANRAFHGSRTQWILANGGVVQRVNADDDAFLLSALFAALGIVVSGGLYVNWYRFDDVDWFEWPDVDAVFGDIWYAGAEDVDLFDGSNDWIVSVGHSGVIRIIHLGRAD